MPCSITDICTHPPKMADATSCAIALIEVIERFLLKEGLNRKDHNEIEQVIHA